jgi:hypothetical protein
MVAPLAQGRPADASRHADGAEGESVFYERERASPGFGTVHSSSIDPATDKTAGEVNHGI